MSSDAQIVGVGDVRMVRTFRVGNDGGLYPVNTAAVWVDGWNTARCGRGKSHPPPDPRCRCGFYLYAHPAYALAQPPARQVLAVVAAHGAMEAGSRGARVREAHIEAVWLGPRVSDQLAATVRWRYPSVMVFRDRAAMFADFALTPMVGFVPPRVGEVGRDRLRVARWLFCALVGVLGALPAGLTLGNAAMAALWLTVLAVAVAITGLGALQRSSTLTFVGITAVAWMVTAGSMTTIGGVLYRVLLLATVASFAIVWLRAARPGRTISDARLDSTLRRWHGQLPGSR